MTLPDEVVKEIDRGRALYKELDPDSLTVGFESEYERCERIALLTRRLTIEECAKVCDEIRARARPMCEANYTDGDSWVATCASAIRKLEGK